MEVEAGRRGWLDALPCPVTCTNEIGSHHGAGQALVFCQSQVKAANWGREGTDGKSLSVKTTNHPQPQGAASRWPRGHGVDGVDNYMAKTEGTATELEIILYFIIIMWKMRWELLALTSWYPQHWEYGCDMVQAQETFPGWMSEGTQAFHCIPCPYPGKTSPITEGKSQIFDRE